MSPRPLPLSLAIALAIAGMGGMSAWAGNASTMDKAGTGNKAPNDKASTDKTKDNDKDKDNTLPASVRRIERETGGKVLRAQPIQRDGREIYRVKIVTPQGRVRVMEDDAGPSSPPDALRPPADLRRLR